MEFTDIKSKDFIELAGIPEHLHGIRIAEHRVKWRLREILEHRGIKESYEAIFFTTFDEGGVVIYSKSLVEILTEAVVDTDFSGIGLHGGLFRQRGVTSFDQLIEADIALINEAMQIVYKHIKQTEQAG